MIAITQLDQLPFAPPPMLVGRAEIFHQMTAALAEDQAVWLAGIEGIGKHALVTTFAANRLQAWQPILWLTTTRPLEPQILRAYSYFKEVDEVLKEQTPLVILEVGEHVERATPFLQKYPETLVIHTQAVAGQWRVLNIPPLDHAASQQLFTQWAGNRQDPKTQANVLVYLAGHPFTLKLVAQQVASGIKLAEFYGMLPAPAYDLRQRALQIIQVAFQFLDAAHQGLLLALAANFGRGVSLELLTRLVGNSGQVLCQNLAARGFLIPHTNFYYISPLIQAFAREQLSQHRLLREAQNRMIGALLNFVELYTTHNHTLIYAEMESILNAAHFCLEIGQLESLRKFVHALSALDLFVADWGYSAELDALKGQIEATQPQFYATDSVLQRSQAPENLPELEVLALEPSPEETVALIPPELAETQISAQTTLIPHTSSTALTTQQQSLDLALQDATLRQDRPEMARLNLQLGDYHLEQNAISPAIYHYEQAVTLYQGLGDLTHLLTALEALATVNLDHNNVTRALEYARQGLNIARQLDDAIARSRYMSLLGDIFLELDDHKNAAESYKRAIKLARMLEDHESTGVLLTKLAAIYMDYARYREASVAISQAISLFEQIRRPDLLGRALGNLGTALGNLGRWREAGQRHAAALRIARQLGDAEEERFQLGNLAYVAEVEGHLKWAINYHRQALYLALLEEDERSITDLTYDLARLLVQDPELSRQAVVMLETALRYQSSPELKRWLKECKVRVKQRERAGLPLEPEESDLVVYAGEAYPQ